MFKTISAAVLAVSVLAAPAFAAGRVHTHAPAFKSAVLNANAKMLHRHHHIRKPIHRHHRIHKHR